MDGSIARSAPVLGKMAEEGERLGREERKARKESPEEKACLFASDKPAHRNCLLPFSTAFGFPLLVQYENLRDRFSPSREVLYDSQCGNCLSRIQRTDGRTNPDPIARDFNMNCLLMATCPRGTTAHTSILRIIGLSAAASARCRDVVRHLLPIVEISRDASSRSGRAEPRLSAARTDLSARRKTTHDGNLDRVTRVAHKRVFILLSVNARLTSISVSRRRIYIYMLPSNPSERYNFRTGLANLHIAAARPFAVSR